MTSSMIFAAATGAAGGSTGAAFFVQVLPLLMIFVVFYLDRKSVV